MSYMRCTPLACRRASFMQQTESALRTFQNISHLHNTCHALLQSVVRGGADGTHFCSFPPCNEASSSSFAFFAVCIACLGIL